MSEGIHNTREALHPKHMHGMIQAVVGVAMAQAFPFDFETKERIIEMKRSIDRHMPIFMLAIISELKPKCRCESCVQDEKVGGGPNPHIMKPVIQ